MEIKGILKRVSQQIERGENGKYVSRKVHITTEAGSNYPQTIEVEVSGEKVNLFNNVAIGSEVTCSINLRGREWTNSAMELFVFNTLQCWKVSAAETKQQPAQQEPDLTGDLPF